jgi:hypothetical protein
MNKRIKELAEQAGFELDDELILEPQPIYYITQEECKKFAELIVKECIDTVKKRYVGDHNREDAEVLRCVKDLKQHFGVES